MNKTLATLAVLFIFGAFSQTHTAADEFQFIDPSGKKVTLQLPPGAKPPELPPGARPVTGEESSKESKPSGKEESSKEESGGDQEPPLPKVIRRENALDDQGADKSELKARVGEDGKVAFEFRNQPWIDLVQWLADISDQPLDWLELPGDRVNLRSPGRYTVEQTRDLFNRYLLARGYTLLEIDGGLTVAKIESINPAIVPRVASEDLDEIPMHSFVRTSLDIGWLSAEKLATELAPMISSNGKLTALTTTNRIEAMDAAVNLRQVVSLLEQERNATAQEALAPEFVLRYLSADEAKEMLEQFLGIEKKKSPALTPQQLQRLQRSRQQQKNAAPQPKKPDISIVANTRQNSILIRAPADRVAIAREFIKRIDVPGASIKNLVDVKSRLQVFRLAALDPEKLVEIVSEMNVLEPSTHIRVDKDNNALIVSGSAADRYVINSLIERLDGSGRRFEVMPLRRLDPNEVAESITFLMGQKSEEDDSSSRRRSYYYGGYYGNDNDDKEKDEFRVAANTRLRQILLWANDQEMEQVRSLLVKLGELPPPGGSRQTRRVLDASATPETLEYLQRLKMQWNRLSPNPLELPDESQFSDPNERDLTEDVMKETAGQGGSTKGQTMGGSTKGQGKSKPASDEAVGDSEETSAEPAGQGDGTIASTAPAWSRPVEDSSQSVPQQNLVAMQQPPLYREGDSIKSSQDFDRQFLPSKRPKPPADPKGPAAAIRIELDPQGNLILISPDTKALDELEHLMLQVKPPKRPYVVFHVKNASATWMKLNLESYFKDLDGEEDSDADNFFRWYWGDGSNDKEEKPSGLGAGNKLRFVSDIDTNTIVVTSASSEQLQTIKELIELWDVPEPVNKRKTRFTRLVAIKYGKANKIAETVKEAYRDLLSSNDKTFARGQRGKGGGGGDGSTSNDVAKSRGGSGSGLEDSKSGRDGGDADFSFKGKLSIGIDTVGNTLLVSAEGEPLLDLVTEMVGQIDEAARPSGDLEIINMTGRVNGDTLRKALQAMGASPLEKTSSSESSTSSPTSSGKRDEKGLGGSDRRGQRRNRQGEQG